MFTGNVLGYLTHNISASARDREMVSKNHYWKPYQWSRDQWHHVTPKGQGLNPKIFEVPCDENCARCKVNSMVWQWDRYFVRQKVLGSSGLICKLTVPWTTVLHRWPRCSKCRKYGDRSRWHAGYARHGVIRASWRWPWWWFFPVRPVTCRSAHQRIAAAVSTSKH